MHDNSLKPPGNMAEVAVSISSVYVYQGHPFGMAPHRGHGPPVASTRVLCKGKSNQSNQLDKMKTGLFGICQVKVLISLMKVTAVQEGGGGGLPHRVPAP